MKRPREKPITVPSLQEYAVHTILGAAFPEEHMRRMALRILTRHYKPSLHADTMSAAREANGVMQILNAQARVMRLPLSVVCETCNTETDVEYDGDVTTTDVMVLEERHLKRVKNGIVRMHTHVLKVKGAL